MIKLKDIISEEFIDIAKIDGKDVGDWVKLSKPKIKPIVRKDFPTKKNIFDLINHAYMTVLKEPNASIKSPEDVVGPDYDYWEAIDIDGHEDADAVIFGKKRNGIKLSGLGHDGEKISKSLLVKKQLELLSKNGYWVEASGKPAELMLKARINQITDKDTLQKLFPDAKFLEFFEDGAYIRTEHKSGKLLREYVFGHPIM